MSKHQKTVAALGALTLPKAGEMKGPPPNEPNADQEAWDAQMAKLTPEQHDKLIAGWVDLWRAQQAKKGTKGALSSED